MTGDNEHGDGSGAVSEVVEWLENWGATDILVGRQENPDTATVDFHTPFPGDQPIRSSVDVVSGEVQEATIRYGVLDADLFAVHPTDDEAQVDRLKHVATRSGVPDVGLVLVNYGDPHRVPRPHVLWGWAFSMANDYEVVIDDDPERWYPMETFMDVTKTFGRNVRQEFRDEWVDDGE